MLNTVNNYPLATNIPKKYSVPINYSTNFCGQEQKDTYVSQNHATKHEKSFWERHLAAIIGITSIAVVGLSIINTRKNNMDAKKYIYNLQQSLNEQNTKSKTAKLFEKFEPDKNSPKGFKDVIGMDLEKEKLKRLVLNPLESNETKEIYEKQYGLQMPSGILLESRPGNGKTFLVEALAKEIKTDLYKLKMSDFGSSYIHGTGKGFKQAITELKQEAKIKYEKDKKPIIVFLDELDGITPKRAGEAKSHELDESSTYLQELHNLQDHNILLIGATNRKDLIDEGMLRPGRFGEHIFVGDPNEKARESFVTRFLHTRPKGQELLQDKTAINSIVKDLDGCSNAEIKEIINNSARLAFEDKKSPISKQHIDNAINDFKESRQKAAA